MNFLTGATGFLGSYLADYLLQEDNELFVLSRSSKGFSAEQRFLKALSLTSQESGNHHPNLIICEGDVTMPMFGLNNEDLEKIKKEGVEELWHSAGSISFSEKDREQTFKINLGGMINLLNFAERVRAKEIHYISTAYSGGNRYAKTFYGEDLPEFNNCYEESKFCSENMLSKWAKNHPAVKVMIYKPSIVVGDTINGRAFNFSGFYRYFQVFFHYRNKLEKKGMTTVGDKINLPITLPGSENAEINIISIDYAVNMIMSLRNTGLRGVFPVVNDSAPSYKEVVGNALRFFNISGVKFSNGRTGDRNRSDKTLARIERVIALGLVDYRPYITWTYSWDLERTKKALGEKYKKHPEFDYAFSKLILEYAVRHNFDLTV